RVSFLQLFLDSLTQVKEWVTEKVDRSPFQREFLLTFVEKFSHKQSFTVLSAKAPFSRKRDSGEKNPTTDVVGQKPSLIFYSRNRDRFRP
ncbi:MAG: hypothetical protein IJD59_05270, partial [Clostridia bacterium]|nr:hypothetical protein [Clostridia bacterium]